MIIRLYRYSNYNYDFYFDCNNHKPCKNFSDLYTDFVFNYLSKYCLVMFYDLIKEVKFYKKFNLENKYYTIFELKNKNIEIYNYLMNNKPDYYLRAKYTYKEDLKNNIKNLIKLKIKQDLNS